MWEEGAATQCRVNAMAAGQNPMTVCAHLRTCRPYTDRPDHNSSCSVQVPGYRAILAPYASLSYDSPLLARQDGWCCSLFYRTVCPRQVCAFELKAMHLSFERRIYPGTSVRSSPEASASHLRMNRYTSFPGNSRFRLYSVCQLTPTVVVNPA